MCVVLTADSYNIATVEDQTLVEGRKCGHGLASPSHLVKLLSLWSEILCGGPLRRRVWYVMPIHSCTPIRSVHVM